MIDQSNRSGPLGYSADGSGRVSYMENQHFAAYGQSEFSQNADIYAALAVAAASGGMMDGRSFMAPTTNSDLVAAASNGGGGGGGSDSSYPLYRHPHSGYPGAAHHAGGAPSFSASPTQSSGNVDTFNKGQKYSTPMRSPLNTSPASSAYSPPAQFRGTPNGGSLFGAYGGFYVGPQPTSTPPDQQTVSGGAPERHASTGGSSNPGEGNSYVGTGTDGGGGGRFVAHHHHHRHHPPPPPPPPPPHHHHHSDSGPLQQDIHAN
uniref:Homeobox domain-containing protein n=2 Tax=Mesocestoides corti TaxID=53468 RepID=A0A5K3FSU0_MESCO